MIDSDHPLMTSEEAHAFMQSATHPHMTNEAVEARVDSVSYMGFGPLMICIVRMVNGYSVVESWGPGDPRNYNAEVAKRLAFERAMRVVFFLEGYLVTERISRGEPLTAAEHLAVDRAVGNIPFGADIDFSELYGVKTLPCWRSHKLVFGVKIVGVTGVVSAAHPEGKERWLLEGGGHIDPSADLAVRGGESPVGGFLVIYEGGFESWSPGDVFLNGYSML